MWADFQCVFVRADSRNALRVLILRRPVWADFEYVFARADLETPRAGCFCYALCGLVLGTREPRSDFKRPSVGRYWGRPARSDFVTLCAF